MRESEEEAALLRDSEGPERNEAQESLVNRYVQECVAYKRPTEPGVLGLLQSGSSKLYISTQSDGSLTCLYNILCKPSQIRELYLNWPGPNRRKGAAAVDMILLEKILSQNDDLEYLDLSKCGIDQTSIQNLKRGLDQARVKGLNLSHNCLNHEGGVHVVKLLDRKHFNELDVSFCGLTSSLIGTLKQKTRKTQTNLICHGNCGSEELCNAMSHGFGLILSVLGTFLLFYRAWGGTEAHLWGVFLYGFSLITLYAVSCLFHAFYQMRRTRVVFEALDHCGIYLLIAGSYSPFCLFYSDKPGTMEILLVEWGLALVGICLHIYGALTKQNQALIKSIELGLYVCMGWYGILYYKTLFGTFSPTLFKLVLGGGLFYTIGIPFFLIGETLPVFHVLWHFFVLLGSLLHYLAVTLSLQEVLGKM